MPYLGHPLSPVLARLPSARESSPHLDLTMSRGVPHQTSAQLNPSGAKNNILVLLHLFCADMCRHVQTLKSNSFRRRQFDVPFASAPRTRTSSSEIDSLYHQQGKMGLQRRNGRWTCRLRASARTSQLFAALCAAEVLLVASASTRRDCEVALNAASRKHGNLPSNLGK